MRVFCPEHKRGFFAPRQSPIKCENRGHVLGTLDFEGEPARTLVELMRALPSELPIAIEAPVKQMEFLPATERAWMALEGMMSIFERAPF